jgi:hypothetical protein
MRPEVDIRPAFLTLFRECFEGKPEGQDFTWFVQDREGIFDALATTSAAKASAKPSPDCNSIAAHAYHILYSLSVCNAYIGGPPIEGNWETSWAKQSVSEEEWAQLAKDIRAEFEFYVNWFETQFPDREVAPADLTGPIGILPHMAYHLGAIRQLMKV